ncbi:MAG: DEAD/DEAH box helicase, partial [Bacteroidales bacterium]|nr:DEAD/DEAH box helicase [Bacteroidales bacterium]
KSQTEADPRIRGMVKKAKKKVKPNYKRKLNDQIKKQLKKNKGADFNRKKKK